jgi:diaminopimelate epimerase
VEGLDKIDVPNLGRQIRFHGKFAPAGTNVDFAQVLNRSSIKVRTYERGVEDETLACGTGAVASALLYAMRYPLYATRRVNVVTKSGETLKVYFEKVRNKFSDVWLEGKAGIAYKGEYYV